MIVVTIQGTEDGGKHITAYDGRIVIGDEQQKIIDEAISQTKQNLPYKIDDSTVWTDVYAQNNEIHYTYKVEMDTSTLSPEQSAALKPVLEIHGFLVGLRCRVHTNDVPEFR